MKTLEMREACKNFRVALELLHLSENVEEVTIPEGKDNHFPELIEIFQRELRDAYPDTQFEVNLNGGTKPMNIAMYKVFQDVPGIRFYYTEKDRPREILDFLKGTTAINDCRQLPLDVFLAGYGFEFIKSAKIIKNIKMSEETAWERRDLTRLLALHCKELSMWNQEMLNDEQLIAWRKEAMDKKKNLQLKSLSAI